MSSQKFKIYALSDATGELAHKLAKAVVVHFPDHDPEIICLPHLMRAGDIEKHVLSARDCHAVIVFTFSKSEVRRRILEIAARHKVVAIDIMGPALDSLANYFHTLPSAEPRLHYKQTRHYFKRTEAVEYTMKHDSGLGTASLADADVIIFGVSRSSKSPLSMYLACQGYRCANVPVILGHDVAEPILAFDRKKMVGLIMDVGELKVIRSSRMNNLGRSDDELYADEEHISKEIQHASELYGRLGIPVINVSGMAIEEVANQICQILKI